MIGAYSQNDRRSCYENDYKAGRSGSRPLSGRLTIQRRAGGASPLKRSAAADRGGDKGFALRRIYRFQYRARLPLPRLRRRSRRHQPLPGRHAGGPPVGAAQQRAHPPHRIPFEHGIPGPHVRAQGRERRRGRSGAAPGRPWKLRQDHHRCSGGRGHQHPPGLGSVRQSREQAPRGRGDHRHRRGHYPPGLKGRHLDQRGRDSGRRHRQRRQRLCGRRPRLEFLRREQHHLHRRGRQPRHPRRGHHQRSQGQRRHGRHHGQPVREDHGSQGPGKRRGQGQHPGRAGRHPLRGGQRRLHLQSELRLHPLGRIHRPGHPGFQDALRGGRPRPTRWRTASGRCATTGASAAPNPV